MNHPQPISFAFDGEEVWRGRVLLEFTNEGTITNADEISFIAPSSMEREATFTLFGATGPIVFPDKVIARHSRIVLTAGDLTIRP